MPELLLELFSEEIPARMQAQAARDLERMARERLASEGFLPEAMKAFAGPRRLTLVIEGLAAAQADRVEERKGPRVGAPDAAISGFLRSAGVERDALVERDGVYFATIARAGRPTAQIIAEMVEAIVRGFPWPKSMTWGSGSLRWVRPLRRILCVFDGEIVPFAIEGIESGVVTEGHRFMGSGQAFSVKGFEAYQDALAKHFVVLDVEERKATILEGARTLAFARGLELVEDEGLLNEVAGLAEWPVPIMGDMDSAFLTLPPEVIRTSMRNHQKYFAVREAGSGMLAPHFVTVANIEAPDGGKAIAAGNARVLSSRLNDAQFFWGEDRKVPLADRLERLKGVTFHAKLGSMFERVERLEALAADVAPLVGADLATARLAARLAKADLVTQMVGEFPELQGVMGGYYAEAERQDERVAGAIRAHYKPQGPSDDAPTAPVSAAVALADKLDTLVSFFAINEKPTGSRDPYALRRAALGVIRIILAGGFRISLRSLCASHDARVGRDGPKGDVADLLAFLAERLKVQLREEGQRHDLVDAVFALGDDDLVRIVARISALERFLATEDGANLLAGYKRAANILKAEARKGELPVGEPQTMAGAPAAEAGLIVALDAVKRPVTSALEEEDFATAMQALSELRAPVDAFFEEVLVNSDNAAERDNRLRILSKVGEAMGRVADFSQVAG